MRSVRAPTAWALVMGLFLLYPARASAQSTDDVQARVGATIKKKLSKRWALALNPEMRTSGLDPERYLLEGTVGYRPIRYFTAKASLRGDVREQPDGADYGARAGLALVGSLPLGDFEAEGRVFYTYDFGNLRSERHRLRYR
ncbi:MAG TPA: hypothetical protein VLC09_19920, partial [Polyangiaceae bacterium]|nr:hypothetical protein [Polyangiaceae bacterium]